MAISIRIQSALKASIGLLLAANCLYIANVNAADSKANNLSVEKKQTEAEKEEQQRLKKIADHKKLVDGLVNHIKDIPGLLKAKKISATEVPDPHWQKNKCISCHTENAEKASASNLRERNNDASCSYCHRHEDDHSYIHPVDMKPSRSKMLTMNASMKQQIKQSAGKVTCSTCHDISLQCKMENRQRHENPSFFRSGPYSRRYQLCTQCHDKESYQRFNPHEQIDDRGKIIESKCRVCHDGDIDILKEAKDISEVSFHIKDGLNAVCWGCHQWKPHPGGSFNFFKSGKKPNHLVKPPEEILQRIKKTLKEKKILMPLEPETGRVVCATCHNPHAKGVIKNKAAAMGAESKSRLRSEKVCNNCHIM